MSNELVSTIYDHYKDTHSITCDTAKRRDRSMLFVIIALGFFAFQNFFPNVANTMVSDFLNFKFGINLKLDLSTIGNVVWFLLLIFTLRYFQAAVFVERQYTYIHKLEEKLNKQIGEEVVTREGKSYLTNYPLFSDWMWVLYTIIFPVLLLVITTAKIVGEFRVLRVEGWSFGLILDAVIFALLTVSIILYLIMLHRKLKK